MQSTTHTTYRIIAQTRVLDIDKYYHYHNLIYAGYLHLYS